MVSGGFSLRRATVGDARDAARIIAAALAEYSLPFEPEGRDADVAAFGAKEDAWDVIAEIDGVVVGIVSVAAQDGPGAGVAWVSKLFVAKDARGRGVGRALLRAAHEHARAAGFDGVGLRTRRIFRQALALYAAEGYERRDAGDPRVLEGGDVVLYRAL